MRDITASLLSEECHGVSTKPHLQPLSGESMSHRSAITDDGARLDIGVNGFWGGGFIKAFLDARVFNACARSNQQVSLTSMYRRQRGLVMSTTGGMG